MMQITENMLLFGGVALTLFVPAMRASPARSTRVNTPIQEVQRHQVYRLPPRRRITFGSRVRRVFRTFRPASRPHRR
jgi:hypothetical protein